MELRVRRLSNLQCLLDTEATGHEMFQLIRELFCIYRSITGNGLRRLTGPGLDKAPAWSKGAPGEK